MHLVEILQTDWKAQVHGGHNVLQLVFHELHGESQLLQDAGKLPGANVCLDLVAGTRANDLACPEY